MEWHTSCFFFFFNDTATTEIYTLSLHDALPICWTRTSGKSCGSRRSVWRLRRRDRKEHTSELQSHVNLVCRLLLEKKKNKQYKPNFDRHHRTTHHTQRELSRCSHPVHALPKRLP